LRTLTRKLQREPLVSELIHPNARHHLRCSLVRASLGARFRCRCSLTAKLPAVADEMVHRIFGFEHKDGAEFLDSHPESRLDFEHLHVRYLFGGVVEGETLALTAASEQNLHPEIAEGSISGRRFNGGLRGGPRLVKSGQ